MAIGDLLHQTPVTTPDPYTGCPVTRLTPPDHTSHHMYFYNRMVTSDSSRLLYCAEINGRRNLYLMELATGDAQLRAAWQSVADHIAGAPEASGTVVDTVPGP